jgi:two-component system, cell cycle sensor histidine kinase and response regulator CckA
MSSTPPPLESDVVLRALASAISDVVLVLGRDGRYRNIISQRPDLLAHPSEHLIGRTVHEVFAASVADEFVRWIAQALETRRLVEQDYEIEIDGRRTWFAAVIAPLDDDAVIWVARDITERKVLEAQLRQAAKMEAVGRLAGGVAHDFNNLLTAISTNAELALLAAGDPAGVGEELAQIKRAAERAAALARQLLAFSRKQMLEPRVIRINGAVREAGELLTRVIGEDVQLFTYLDDDAWPVFADPGQLTQVVMNLAVNARDAMPTGGALTITTGNVDVNEALAARQPGLLPGEYAVLTVRDTGTGMDRRTQERIFEPFFTTKAQGKGTGLGLSTVYGIVQQSGGHIQLASTVGRGTTFWIFLPRAEVVEREPEPPAPAQPPAMEPVATGTTLLIVEDEPPVRGALARVLRRHGYTVLEAQHGLDALAVWAEHGTDISLIVTDVIMPQLGGRELVQRLRDYQASVPVLFMSGYAEGGRPGGADDASPSAFIAKPFDIRVFVRVVADLIESSAAKRLSLRAE